ncbi:MAG: T9SS type A sorting domain-containing protein [Chryseolinea sp.]
MKFSIIKPNRVVGIALPILTIISICNLYAQQLPYIPKKKTNSGPAEVNTIQSDEPTSAVVVPAVINIDPCAGSPWNASNPDRAGRFIAEGDFELFAGSLVGNTPGSCVVTDLTATHAVQSLQQSGCYVSKWKVSHGTPEVCVQPVEFSQDNRFLHIWSGDWSGDGTIEGEGIFYDCALNSCGFYEISLLLKSTAPIKKILFYAASGLVHRPKDGTEATSGEVPFYDKPNIPNAQQIAVINNFNSQNWVRITLPVFRPNGPDMKFWMYTEDDKFDIVHNGVDLLFIDEVTDGTFGSNATCSKNMVYATNSVVPQIVRGISITAPVTITPAKYTDFGASSFIKLTPGFNALSGSNFYAHIVPCSSGSNCPAPPPNTLVAPDESAQSKLNLEVYPNPAVKSINVEKKGETIKEMKIYRESDGQEVGFSHYTETKDAIEAGLENLQPGTYILMIRTSAGTQSSRIVLNK